jgi:outer membrane PBP1 activator LpoA protein
LPSSLARFNAILLAAFLAAPSAFSADPPRETTPPAGLAPSTVVTPLRDPASPARPPEPAAPAQAPAAASPARQPVPAGPAPHVALILPLSSPALGPVAEAVRQGFMAAGETAGVNALPVRVYPAIDDGPAVLELCRQAQAQGAVLVVAGLTRDGATGLARSDCPRQPTLVLNQPQEAQMPARMYSISLVAEQEARQVALMAVNDGWRAAIVIASPSPLARRVADAFEREWSRAAGEVRRVAYAGGPDEAPLVKERIAALRGDMVFLALDQAGTRAVRPYISGSLPIYTTSIGVDPRADATVNVDLEGVRYVDMPWFVQPDHPAVMIYPPPAGAMAVEQERLYALGIDAYRLSGMLLQSDAKSFTLDGVTGRITLEPDQHFTRTLVPAVFDAGRAVPLRSSP